MTATLRPPALDLPDQAAVRWTSFAKVIRQPEQNWPAQICERPIIAGRIGRRTMALIADPEAARAVLAGSEEHFPKWRIYEHMVAAGTGRESLSATTGAKWRRLRRAFSPMFRPEVAALLVPLVQRATARAIAAWGAEGDPVRLDVSLEATRLTLEVMWRVLFGAIPQSDPPPLVVRVAEQIHAAQLRCDINAASEKLSELADAAARRPPAESAMPGNPFGDWTSAERSKKGLSQRELYDNARNLLAAGHETTALTLTWALWLVGQDGEAQHRVHQEIDEVVGGGAVEDAHVGRLAFTGQVLRETLRLFPPALLTVRQSRAPVVLAGERLPAGTVLAVCIYALHRHRDWWEDPDLFRPERFAPGSGEPRHRYAYLPFSAGRHACIGAAFGWKEVVTIFATVLQQFRVDADRTAAVRPRMSITLRPDREVPIVLHRRRCASGTPRSTRRALEAVSENKCPSPPPSSNEIDPGHGGSYFSSDRPRPSEICKRVRTARHGDNA